MLLLMICLVFHLSLLICNHFRKYSCCININQCFLVVRLYLNWDNDDFFLCYQCAQNKSSSTTCNNPLLDMSLFKKKSIKKRISILFVSSLLSLCSAVFLGVLIPQSAFTKLTGWFVIEWKYNSILIKYQVLTDWLTHHRRA